MVQIKSRIIIGNPGCGKTFFIKNKISSILSGNLNSVVYVLGSSREYSDTLNAFSGIAVDPDDYLMDSVLETAQDRFVLFDIESKAFSNSNNLTSVFTKLNKKATANEASHLETFIFIDGICEHINKDSDTSEALENLTFSRSNVTTITMQEVTEGLQMISTESDEAILLPAGAAFAYIEKLSKQFGFSVKKAKELMSLAEQSHCNGNMISLKRTGQDAEFVPHLYGFENTTSA